MESNLLEIPRLDVAPGSSSLHKTTKTAEEETLMPPRTPSISDMKTLAKAPLETSAEN